MFALDGREHKRAREAFQHIGRRRSAAALLEPRVPGRADARALRDLFAAQAARATARGGEAERGRVELASALAEIRAEKILVGEASAHPVRSFTTITSLL